MGKITTVLGDISPEELGYTTIHEHPLCGQTVTGFFRFPKMPPPKKLLLPLKT